MISNGPTTEVVDVKLFHGRPCYRLRSVRNWEKVHGHFYDQENGLLVGYAFNAARRGGNGDATETFKEDKDYGGVRMAPETTHPEGKDVVIFLMTSLTYEDGNEDAFALPEAVKTTLAVKKTSGTGVRPLPKGKISAPILG